MIKSKKTLNLISDTIDIVFGVTFILWIFNITSLTLGFNIFAFLFIVNVYFVGKVMMNYEYKLLKEQENGCTS